MSTTSTPKHIPAWKKLGLKLKYAKEEPEKAHTAHNSVANGVIIGVKRKQNTEDGPTEDSTPTDRPTRKSKKSTMKPDKSAATTNGSPPVVVSNSVDSSTAADSTTPARKRKSVSFTPETKTQDGDSVKQIYKTWLASQLASDPSFDPSTLSPALRFLTPSFKSPPPTPPTSDPIKSTASTSVTTTTTTSLPPTPKKEKKKEKTKKKATKDKTKNPEIHSTAETHQPPYLVYLLTHHASPSTWKFSKAHQNHLLKALFSLNRLPTPHDRALLAYLRGLSGASCSRIRKQALEIREEDTKWLEESPLEQEYTETGMENETEEQNRARRQRDYDTAVAHMMRTLKEREERREEWEDIRVRKEWEGRMRKRRRAEVVLWGVGEQEVEPAVQDIPVVQKMERKVVEIRKDGIVHQGAPRKIIFDDDDSGAPSTTTNVTPGLTTTTPPTALNGIKPLGPGLGKTGKPLRKRRKTRTIMPDDEGSSSDSSSDEEARRVERERELKAVEGRLLVALKEVGKGGKVALESDSDSDSDSDESESESDDDSGDSSSS